MQHSNTPDTQIESLRERILREFAALRDMLDKTLRRGTYRERCIVVVSEDRFY